jgi:NADH-quinone oxidoreductase subunit E
MTVVSGNDQSVLISGAQQIEQAPNGIIQAVRTAVRKHGDTSDELIPILNEINRQVGYLPSQALEEVSRLLKISKSQVFSVATFYGMLSTKETGRHVILFCESAPCHVVGGREVWRRLRAEVKLEAGQTSPDKKWTLVAVSCLGVCGVGPVIVIDDEVYGNITPDLIPEILAKYS